MANSNATLGIPAELPSSTFRLRRLSRRVERRIVKRVGDPDPQVGVHDVCTRVNDVNYAVSNESLLPNAKRIMFNKRPFGGQVITQSNLGTLWLGERANRAQLVEFLNRANEIDAGLTRSAHPALV